MSFVVLLLAILIEKFSALRQRLSATAAGCESSTSWRRRPVWQTGRGGYWSFLSCCR